LYNRKLIDTVKSECGGNYGDFLSHVCEQRGEFLANLLHKATAGMGCNEKIVMEVMCLSTSDEKSLMKETWEKKHDANFFDMLRDELSGDFEDFIMKLVQFPKSEEPADLHEAPGQAKALWKKIKKGKKTFGGIDDKAEEFLVTVLTQLSEDQICAIRNCYDNEQYDGRSLEATIKKYLGGDFESACLLLIKKRIDIKCEHLKEALERMNCDEVVISNTLGGVDKAEAIAIAERYQEKYDKSLISHIADRAGGSYFQALSTWLTAIPENNLDNIRSNIAVLDAQLLIKAAVGLGTDERMVVKILCTRTKQQLEAIDVAMRSNHEKTLKEYVVKEMGGDLEQFLKYLQMSEPEFDVHCLNKAFKGMGTNESLVLEILTTRPFRRLQAARELYNSSNDANIYDSLRDELSGPLQRLCIRLLTGPRSGIEFDVNASAEKLHNAGEVQFGTDENVFIEIFTSHTQPQLQEIADAYEANYENSLRNCVESEFSGDLEDALIGLLNDPIETYCRNLKNAMTGMGTDESTINRIIGGNDKKTVHLIADRWFQKYDTALIDVLATDISGDYENAVLTYIKTTDASNGAQERMTEEAEELERQRIEDEAAEDARLAQEATQALLDAAQALKDEEDAKREAEEIARQEAKVAKLEADLADALLRAEREETARIAREEAEEAARIAKEEAEEEERIAREERAEAARIEREEREEAEKAAAIEKQELEKAEALALKEAEFLAEEERLANEPPPTEDSDSSSSSDSDSNSDSDSSDDEEDEEAKPKPKKEKKEKEKKPKKDKKDKKKKKKKKKKSPKGFAGLFNKEQNKAFKNVGKAFF
jgi:hypothetical protein